MAINDEELKQRLKEQMNAVELGEDLILDDGEDYEDQGGLRSLMRDYMIASETPEEEFDLELGSVIKAYEIEKSKGYEGTLSDYMREYFSKIKRAPAPSIKMASETPEEEFEMMKKIELMQEAAEAAEDREQAMGGGYMRSNYKEGTKKKNIKDLNVYDVVDEDAEDEYYRIKEEQMLRKYYPEDYPPSQRTMGMEDLRKMIDKAKKEKAKRAKGGIAGIL